jgi:antitoxin MazE
MELSIKKWGNSLGVRLPKSISNHLGIKEGSIITMSINNDSIEIKKSTSDYSLSEMLSEINSDNLHKEIDTLEPVGLEIW